MGPDQGQRQLGELVDESFETAVFLSPLFDLGEEIHRDVGGVGFALDLPGQVMARVLVAAGAAAAGIAASAAKGDEAGGEHGTVGLELLLAGLEGAADQGGMFRRFHRFLRAFTGPRI